MNCKVAEGLRVANVWGLAFLIIFVPLVFSVLTENIVIIKDTGNQFIVFTLTILWFVQMIENRRFQFAKSPFNVALLILLFECILSAALAPFQYYAVEELARFLAYFLSILLIYNVVQKRFEFELLSWTIVLMIFTACCYGLAQQYNIDFVNWGQKVYVSFMGNANFFAAVLVMVIPFVLGMLCSRRDFFSAFLLIIVYLFGALCIFWTKTRSAWYGFILAHLMFISLQLIFGPVGKWLRNPKILIGILVALLLASAIFTFFIKPSYQGEIDEFLSGVSLQGRTNRVRLVMWMGAMKLLSERPVLGHGIGSFQLVFGRYRPSYYHRWGVSHNSRHAHNEYLEVLLEQGLTGFTCFMLLYASLAWAVWRTLSRPLHRYWKQLLMGLTSGIFGSMIDNVAAPHLRWTSTGTTFFFLIGMAFVLIKLINRQPDPSVAPEPVLRGIRTPRLAHWLVNRNPLRLPVYLGFAALVVVLGWQEWRIIEGDYWLKQGEQALRFAGSTVTEENRSTWQEALNRFTKSVKLNRWNHSALYKIGYIHLQHGRYASGLKHQLYLRAKEAGDNELAATIDGILAPNLTRREVLHALRVAVEPRRMKKLELMLSDAPDDLEVLLDMLASSSGSDSPAEEYRAEMLRELPFGEHQDLRQKLERLPIAERTGRGLTEMIAEELQVTPQERRLMELLAPLNVLPQQETGEITDGDARETYEYITGIAPNYAQIHNNIGLLYQNMGQPWRAAWEFTWATRLENNYKNQDHIGTFLMSPPIQDTYRALAHFGRMAELAMEDWLVDFRRWLHQTAYNPSLAIGFETTAWHADRQNYSRSWTVRGDAWQFAGDTQRSRYYYRRALFWNAKDYEALLGLSREEAIRSNEAGEMRYLWQILDTITYEEVAGNQTNLRMMGMVINTLHPKLEADSENAVLWDMFGWAWYKFGGRTAEERPGALRQAYQYCMRAHQLNPNLPGNYDHIKEIEEASAGL